MGMRREGIKQLYGELNDRREGKEVVTKGGKDEAWNVKEMKENSEARMKDGRRAREEENTGERGRESKREVTNHGRGKIKKWLMVWKESEGLDRVENAKWESQESAHMGKGRETEEIVGRGE